MFCSGSASPRLMGCAFSGNTALRYGGGLATGGVGAPLITDCTFKGNTAGIGGGAASFLNAPANPRIEHCTFAANAAQGSGSWGGGALLVGAASAVTLQRCTFYGNACTNGGGLLVTQEGTSVVIDETIISFCSTGAAIACGDSVNAVLGCSDLYGNAGGDWVGCIAGQLGTNGNFSADPLFCDPETGDLRLEPDSPCAEGNSPPGCGFVGAWGFGCSGSDVPDRGPKLCGCTLGPSGPSPFSRETAVRYQLAVGIETDDTSLTVHDVNGRLVRVLQKHCMRGGPHVVWWDGTDELGKPVPGGIYFLTLTKGATHALSRVSLIR